MMNFKKIAKATAVIRFETDDAKRYIDKGEDFDLAPNWLGKIYNNKITKFEFEVCGLRKRNTNWMLIVKDTKNSTDQNKIYNLLSLREFFTQCEMI